MKKLPYLLIFAILLITMEANAQTPFSTKEFVDINNIKATVLMHGDMFWDPALGTAQCNFPATAPTNINFTSALWMSGYDNAGHLHVAAQTYRQNGNDYWPGPLNTSDTLTYATSSNWAKIWKVNRTDITTFLALPAHTIANTPPMILTWPAKGNVNAQGNGGAALSITNDMAPFVDLNHNNIYEPLLGEYPNITGDQALWWVFSDNGPTHSETIGKPLGVEIQAMAYAYKRGTLMDNVIYFDYRVINRSPNNYTNFRMGLFDDVDLGYAFDDFIGFDSAHRMGIGYSATSDDGGGAGHPVNSYNTTPPIVGVSMVVLPGDDPATHSHKPAGSFIYYNNDFSDYGNPGVDTEYNNYLRSKFRKGAHLTNDFAGAGIQSTGYGVGPNTDYVFTGDPSVNTEWSECVSNNNPGDRKFIITSNDFTMNSGNVREIVMALIVTPKAANNGCPLAGFSTIKNMADTVWNIFNDELLSRTSVPITGNENTIAIYPNPAHDKLFIDHSAQDKNCNISIYNVLGQKMSVAIDKVGSGSSVNISGLPGGVYTVIYRNKEVQKTGRFIKE